MTVSDLGCKRADGIDPGDILYRDGHDPYTVDRVYDDGSRTVTFSGLDADDRFSVPSDAILEVS